MDVPSKASCMKLLQRAEKGLDTMIGEGGLKLSGGKTTTVHRPCLLRKPTPLLIFDEATGALDSLTEGDHGYHPRRICRAQSHHHPHRPQAEYHHAC